MNRWKIPIQLEIFVRERDQNCVYCRKEFDKNHGAGSLPSWEHIINDVNIITKENIAIACRSCNSSKGAKDLIKWLDSEYCLKHNITRDTVSDVIKDFLKK